MGFIIEAHDGVVAWDSQKSRAIALRWKKEMGKVPMSGKYLISLITWLFQSTENYSELENPPVPVSSIMGSLHESKG
jgi:hypothetical protein